MASSQIEQLRIYYETLSVNQKKEFINKLREQVKNTNSPTHLEFLNECILKCNTEHNYKISEKRNATTPVIINNNFYKKNSDTATVLPEKVVYNYNVEEGGYPMKTHTPSLVLSIVGLVFALLITYVTYACSIVGLVMAIKNRHTYKTMPAMIMCIIGLAVALVNSVVGIMMYLL